MFSVFFGPYTNSCDETDNRVVCLFYVQAYFRAAPVNTATYKTSSAVQIQQLPDANMEPFGRHGQYERHPQQAPCFFDRKVVL